MTNPEDSQLDTGRTSSMADPGGRSTSLAEAGRADGESFVRLPFGAIRPADDAPTYPTLVQASRDPVHSDLGAARVRLIRYGLVPVDDFDCLTSAMRRAITDLNLRHRSGKDGRMMGLNLKICGDRGNRLNFTVTSNTANQPVAGPISSGELATFTGSTGVMYQR